MADANGAAPQNGDKPKKKKKSLFARCCISALIAALIIFLLIAGGCAVGLVYADKYLKQNYDIGVADGWHILTGVLDANEKKIVTDPAGQSDETEMYSQLKKALFLNQSADLEGVLDTFVADVAGGAEQAEAGSYNAAANAEENTAYDLIADLYAEGNLDLERLRAFVGGNTDIDAVYDEEFTARIAGNGLVPMVERLLREVLSGNAETAAYVQYVSVKQISFDRIDGVAAISAVLCVETRAAAAPEIEKQLTEAAFPSFVISVIKSLIPEKTYASAQITLSKPVAVSVNVNTLSDSSMDKIFALIEKFGGEDVRALINDRAEEALQPLREEIPYLFDALDSADDDGFITLDIYGILADVLNSGKTEQQKVSGEELVSFVVGALGSEKEKAVAQKISENPEFGEPDWRTEQAQKLVSAMAESFALAESYFVNGTDENGDKIVSTENGVVAGVDGTVDRIYADAAGNLYRRESGGKFKVYISESGSVSDFARTGYEEFITTYLHYDDGGKDYTLYRSVSGETIYGVCGGEIQSKNGTYTELTTFYVDSEGNAYARQNSQGTLIEVTKEKLEADTIFNIIQAADDADGNPMEEIAEKLLDFVDFSELRRSGVEQWLEPMRITAAQLGALTDEIIDRFLSDDMLKTQPQVVFCGVEGTEKGDFITLGVTLDITAVIPEEYAELAGVFISDDIYAEVKCEVTPGKTDENYAPVEIRYNNLSGDYTGELLATLDKLAGGVNLTGELENAAREIRSAIASYSENVKFDFVDGAVETASPADVILLAINADDAGIEVESFLSAVNMLLHSDSAAAIAFGKYENPDFAADDWLKKAVDELAQSLAEAFILDETLLADETGEGYSLDKITEIIKTGSFTFDDVAEYLDYETMKKEGFGSWKNRFAASDAAVAAIVDRVKNESFAQFDAADPRIEYVHMFEENGREFISVGLSLDPSGVLTDNSLLVRIADVLDERIFLSMTLDVTAGADEYTPSLLQINDLTPNETDEVLSIMSSISDRLDKQTLFGEAESQVRSSLDEIRESVGFEITDGAVMFDSPQDIIYDAVIGEDDAFSPDDMTDALTAFTLAGNGYFAENNGYEADTSGDEAAHEFWNTTLSDKYFMNIDIKELFTKLTSEENVYETAINALDRSLFAPGGVYAHATIEDAYYKAGNSELSYLFRDNSQAIADMVGSKVVKNIEIFDIYVQDAGTAAEVGAVIAVPVDDIIDYMGEMDSAVADMIREIVPGKLAFNVSWLQGGETRFTICGMPDEDKGKVNDLVRSLTGNDIFGDGSDMATAADTVREYFDDNFEYGTENGEAYVRLPDFYRLVAENVFAPAAGKPEITDKDVYTLMKTLYELPEKGGAFDSSVLGYENDAEEVKAVSAFVSDSTYSVAGASKKTDFSEDPSLALYTTLRYSVETEGDAAKVLPDSVYITLSYQTSLSDIENSRLEAKFNKAETNDATDKCFEYLGVDAGGAIELAHKQLNEYAQSLFGM